MIFNLLPFHLFIIDLFPFTCGSTPTPCPTPTPRIIVLNNFSCNWTSIDWFSCDGLLHPVCILGWISPPSRSAACQTEVRASPQGHSETTVTCKPGEAAWRSFHCVNKPERNGVFSSRQEIAYWTVCRALWSFVPTSTWYVSETDASLTTVRLFMRVNYTCIPSSLPSPALYLHSCFTLERRRVKYWSQLSGCNVELMTLATCNDSLQKAHTDVEIYTCCFETLYVSHVFSLWFILTLFTYDWFILTHRIFKVYDSHVFTKYLIFDLIYLFSRVIFWNARLHGITLLPEITREVYAIVPYAPALCWFWSCNISAVI